MYGLLLDNYFQVLLSSRGLTISFECTEAWSMIEAALIDGDAECVIFQPVCRFIIMCVVGAVFRGLELNFQ